MSRGPSGRLVVELDPDLKHELYIALTLDSMTFKEWLTRQAERYISERRQPLLLVAEPQPPGYSLATSDSTAMTEVEESYTHARRKTKRSRSL